MANVEIEDANKPAVEPVQPSMDTGATKLDNRARPGEEAGSAKSDNQLDREEMEKVIDEVQKRMDAIGSKLRFGLHEHQDVPELVVQITDKDSGELVKQFPAEEVIQIRAKLNDLIGLLFDKQV